MVQISSFALQYSGIDFASVASSSYDLFITEGAPLPAAGHDFPGISDAQVATLQSQGRSVVGYVDAAVTDAIRGYWNPAWTDNGDDLGTVRSSAPAWLKGQPTNGYGVVVKYWDGDWQKIVIDQAVALVRRGYSGIFLDDVGAYYQAGQAAGDIALAADRMIDLIAAIKAAITAVNPRAILIANSDPYIVTDSSGGQSGARTAAYLSAVDAHVLENVSPATADYATAHLPGEPLLLLQTSESTPLTYQEAWRHGVFYAAPSGYGAAGSFAYPATAGNDRLTGGDGPNRIDGLAGNDTIAGGGGADILVGGAGSDTLAGGPGADVFSGTRAELAGDTIADFAIGDRIEVTDAAYYGFGYTRVGSTLTVGVGQSLTLSNNPVGRLVTGGTFDGPAQLGLTSRMTGLADFDGNGHSDILWRENGGTFSTWSVSGNAQGNQFAVNSTLTDGVDPGWKIQETFDFDGDGRSDILWRTGNSGNFTVWTGAAGSFGANAYRGDSVATDWQIAGVGDLNGDGKDDIVWRQNTGAFSTWQSTGAGFNVNVDFDTSVSPDWQIVGLGDFDADGKDDLLWRNQQSGAFSTWTSNGTGFTPNTNFVASVGTTWHIDGIADFNGDGRDDILWRHDGDGAFSVWQANASGGFTPNTYFDTSVAPVWQIATTGDYNDDGRADILWRNTADGTFSTWQSNGNGFDPNTAFVSGVGTNWQVQGHSFQFG